MTKARTKAKPAPKTEGFDGRVIISSSVRVTQTRSESKALRCRPGSFEWRYGAKTDLAPLYHAGISFADLWERAEIGSTASPDLRRSGGGGWNGLPDGRTVALDQIKAARQAIGTWGTARLVDYCVMGSTASEIAAKWNTEDRAMAHILEMDLKAAANHFRLL